MTQDTAPNKPAEDPPVSTIEQPPSTLLGILSRLGPGLIIAGSIVGSGELIATPAVGAEAGFKLLWLILIGCAIKVWVQIELGRYTVCSGKTSMEAINGVPGPSIALPSGARIGWMTCYWLAMFLVSLGQLGGIVGGVGQALAMTWPLTEDGREYNSTVDQRAKLKLELFEMLARRDGKIPQVDADPSPLAKLTREELDEKVPRHEGRIAELTRMIEKPGPGELKPLEKRVYDDKLYAIGLTIVTAWLLVVGRYGFVEKVSTALVAGFTLTTVLTVAMLQGYPTFAITSGDVLQGLSFQLPPSDAVKNFNPLMTALAAFGIIGVGANELIQYPYWCLEKGYARFTGPVEPTQAWADRARGWMRVLTWDCWCSLLVYTFATVAFYLLGAAILGRLQLIPKGNEMIRTLSSMYEPVFGGWTQVVFLIGAFAVLYSTFLIANAGHAHTSADAVRVFSGRERDEKTARWWTKFFGAVFPMICLFIYLVVGHPEKLVIASGAMQAVMLPMLAGAAIWFRWRGVDQRVAPGKFTDVLLWISAAGMLIAGGWLAAVKICDLFGIKLG